MLQVGGGVSYAVVRNINYTNVCYFKCQFCAFSKGKLSQDLRGVPYNLSHEEIVRSANWFTFFSDELPNRCNLSHDVTICHLSHQETVRQLSKLETVRLLTHYEKGFHPVHDETSCMRQMS